MRNHHHIHVGPPRPRSSRVGSILFFVAMMFCLLGFVAFHPALRPTSQPIEDMSIKKVPKGGLSAAVRLQRDAALAHAVARSQEVESVYGLLKRILPPHSQHLVEQFQLQLFPVADMEALGEADVFEISSEEVERTIKDSSSNVVDDGKGDAKKTTQQQVLVTIRGNNGISLAVGLHHYLRTFCNAHFSWSGRQMRLPSTLVHVPIQDNGRRTLRRTSIVPIAYYENVCTFSYSQAFWTWDRWEQEIDWMALHGINLPLALTGYAYIAQRVFEKLGVNRDELQDFFVGPAFQAWGIMGNIKKFATPLPQDFIERQRDLQIKILTRMRSLGMRPVLPAFAGFVPDALRRIFPDEPVRAGRHWSGFKGDECCVTMLDPQSKLFRRIGKMFIQEVIEVYGTSHYYSCDTFNENTPTSNDPAYLSAASYAVFTAMKDADPLAIWVMQGWLFLNDGNFWGQTEMKALLDGVPRERMLILDLHADVHPVFPSSNAFQDRDFVWCALHNFGGQTAMYGRLQHYSQGFQDALATKRAVGVGLTMEGIEQNPAVYEYVLDFRWQSPPLPADEWVELFARRRYGLEGSMVRQIGAAWKLLAQSVYNVHTRQMGATKSVIEVRPTEVLVEKTMFMPTVPGYDSSFLVDAWKVFVTSSPSFRHTDTYLHDLVDITRQVFADYTFHLYKKLMQAFYDKNDDQITSISNSMVGVMVELDNLLNTRAEFMLGTRIEAARAWAGQEELQWHFEWNARNQVTRWGTNGEINDYGSKLWGGLIGTYYIPRWRIFFTELHRAVKDGTRIDHRRLAIFYDEFERSWNINRELQVPHSAFGDVLSIVGRLYQHFHANIEAAFPSRIQTTQPPPPPSEQLQQQQAQ